MVDLKPVLRASEQLRLGRLVFDGADVSRLALRHGISVDEVQAAWAFCREQLSLHFTKAGGEAFRLLDDRELRERSLETIRLLLDWRAGLLDEARIDALAAPGDTRQEPHNVSTNPDNPSD